MKKLSLLFAALFTATVMNLQAADPVSYLYPEYNTSGDPTSGIKEWKTGSCTSYTVVTDASSTVTWNAGWYVVKGTGVSITQTITCSGAVHLILADGAKLTASMGIVVSGDANSIAIYGQSEQTGQLSATGGGSSGIGGAGFDKRLNAGAITINGGIITCTGNSSHAGIGAGFNTTGGSCKSITINGGTVTATGGNNGAGIGGGNKGNGSNITINGGTVTATGGSFSAGIGGGASGTGSNITINGGTVTATSATTNIAGIGKGGGKDAADASNIFVNPSLILKADNANPPTTVIAPTRTATTDIASDLAGKRYATVVSPDMHDFLYFVGLNGNDTVRLNKYATKNLDKLTATFEYSTDRINWKVYDTWATSASPANTYQGDPIALNQGDTVFFRAKGTNGQNATMTNASTTRFTFAFGADDQIAAGGNIMSLYDATCEQDTMTNDGFANLFKNAKQLVSAPKLPAKKVAEFCYYNMFQGCTSLTAAPALPATTLAKQCYAYMFKGCSSLTKAPELKATTLAEGCYYYMFQNCTSLTTAPELPATTLAKQCYTDMFGGCTALTQAPELKATTLAEGCYNAMFQGCTALTKAPELKATILTAQCYMYMFNKCTSLTQAPELKATTLAEMCYYGMFKGCTSLEVNTYSGSCDGAELEVPTVSGTAPTDWNRDMFTGCKGDAALTAQNGIQLGGHYCIKEYVEPDMHDFLYFTSLKADGTGTVKLDKSNAKLLTATFEYSKDRIEWLDYTWPDNSGQGGYAIALENAGDTVFFRAKGEQGKNATMSINPGALFIFAFGTNDSIAAGGNSMSLYDATCEQNSMTNYGFYYLFRDAKQLVSAPKLPATKLASYCYNSMFYNCKALTQAPALSADSLAPYCCQNMFYNCKALTQAPELKATKLASYCYNSMFYNCEALTQAPALPADSLASYCYNGMFYNCKALTQAPELKATKLAPYCCQGMFQECSSLTQAPDLKATKLASYCYNGMFSNCKALTQAPELKATTLADRCCYQMFNACNTLIQAPALPADSLAPLCYYGMFTDCKALTQAPELKATKLADKCYYQMFLNCTALTQAPELPATTLPSSCYSNMFEGCTSLTAAPALPATTLKNGCYNEMFKSCTALTQAPELKAKTLARECYQLMFCLCTSLQVDTLSGDCNGAELVVPDTATAPSNWNQNMFYGCKGTAANNIQLGGHYCIKEYIAPYTRKVTNGNFGTICLDRKFTATEGVEGLFVPYEKTATMLYCEEVELKDIVAGGAYIFKADSDVVAFTMEGEAVTAAINNDHMIGWLAADSTLNAQFYTDHADYYLLANNEITKPTEDSQILKNRAFIDMNFSAPTAPARGRLISFSLNGTDAATGLMQNAQCTMQSGKMMVNGQFVIIRDGKMFNAQGQEL